MADITRCAWAQTDPVMRAYHDTEWGVALRDSRAMWELLMLEGFQAGLSWRMILHRRDHFRQAFANFDPQKVARFGPADVERLMGNGGIIRARAKIMATITGARIYLTMRDTGEDFGSFAWGFVAGQPLPGDGVNVPAQTPLSASISSALKQKGFKFVGPVIVYAWMQAVGMVNDHSANCFCRHAPIPAPG